MCYNFCYGIFLETSLTFSKMSKDKLQSLKQNKKLGNSSKGSIDESNNVNNEETPEICDGCHKPFQPTAILKHVSHSKKCKAAYGNRFEEMKKKKEGAKMKKYYQKNREKILKSEEDKEETFKILSSRPKKELQSETFIQCLGCKSIYGKNSILKHLAKAKRCYDQYSEEELNSIKENSKMKWKTNVNEWQKEHKGEVAAQKAYRYKYFKKSITDDYHEDDHNENLNSDDDFQL